MSAAENLALHIRWNDAENSKNVTVSRWREFVHDDIVINHMDGTRVCGIEAMVKNLVDSMKAMPDWRANVDDRAATDSRITCRWRVSGTPTDTGKRIEVSGISYWTVKDGKVVEGWVCTNAAHQTLQGVEAAGYFAINAHGGRIRKE